MQTTNNTYQNQQDKVDPTGLGTRGGGEEKADRNRYGVIIY